MYVLSLVHEWLATHPEYYHQWVKPYKQLRFNPSEHVFIVCKVGGHWRRLADWASVMPALRCTAKFEVLADNKFMCITPQPYRLRVHT